MFPSDRWADAFVTVCAGHAEEGLAVLKAFVPLLSRLPGRIAGTADALALERMLRAALEAAGTGPGETGAENAVRFVALLVRRGLFKELDAAVRAVEQRVDAQNGVLVADLESARPLEGDLQEALKAALIRKYGAREIRLAARVVPELLGGCRLRVRGDLVDSSVRGHLQRMAGDLHAAQSFKAALSDGGFR
ncbi:MAG: F0F1 ATP synthase subunit delta [Treponema sp.]|jgi:F-type H+-transporting ATPase subunit delta|nr:F0F1 ATP synthase subunit delta [Treponema sp.]